MSEDNVYYNLRMSTETNSKPALTQSELSELFNQECNPISQSTISKIETSKKVPPTKSPEVIKAYCEHFGVTSDYLLGIRDVKTTNEDIAMICKYTGLSEEAIERISNYGEEQKNILNILIADNNSHDDFLRLLLTSLWLYGSNVYVSDITINNHILNSTNTITDIITVKNMLKYDVIESLDFCLLAISQAFESDKETIIERNKAILEKENLLFQLSEKLDIPRSEIEKKIDEMKNNIIEKDKANKKKKGSDTNAKG